MHDWRPAIENAYARIHDHVRRTPVIAIDPPLPGLDTAVMLKLEQLQHTASFKPRGAFNRLLAAGANSAGVIAASGGNHGIATAFAARELGVPAEIYVPEISSPVKIERIRSLGATVHVGGARYADALAASEARAEQSGALVVHAYDQPEVIAGQGTVGLELSEQVENLDTVLVAVGGGGLIGGISGWFAGAARVVAVEPETSCALHAALEAGHPVDVDVAGIAADSLGARRVGTLMFDIARQHVAHSVRVSDAAIASAQRWLWRELRLATEAGGGAAMAALLSGRYEPRAGERIAVVVCGANVDPASITGE